MKVLLNAVLHGNSWPVFIAVLWLFCSWLILSNSFTSVERRFYLNSIQRFGSTNRTTGLRKSFLNLPIIDFLIYHSWNPSSFPAKHADSFGVHCVLCLPLWRAFPTRDSNRIKSLFVFYLIAWIPTFPHQQEVWYWLEILLFSIQELTWSVRRWSYL